MNGQTNPGLGINNVSREDQQIRQTVADHAAARATRILQSIPNDEYIALRFQAALHHIAQNN